MFYQLAVVQPDSKVLVSWQHILQQRLKTLQVHWGQVEKLSQINAHKIYVVIHQNKLDVLVLAFTLMVALQEANIEFLNQNEPHHDFVIQNPALDKEKFPKIEKVLFIDAENSGKFHWFSCWVNGLSSMVFFTQISY